MTAPASSPAAPRRPRGWLERLAWLSAGQRLAFASGIALLIFFLPLDLRNAFTHLLATWDAFACTTLLLCWIAMIHTRQSDIREKARRQDAGTKLIFLFICAAACASMGAVLFIMHSAKTPAHLALHIALSITTVLSAWALLHTVFALHYAHSYYGDGTGKNADSYAKGLDFPGGEEPDYLDFAYFSFVVGMTFQVSDVEITARPLRRIALAHSLLAFAFNTLIIALAINTVSSLLQ